VDGVAQRNPLKGLTTMSHLASVTWDDLIEGKSEAQYTQELETAFELGLLRTGIKLDTDPQLGYLYCMVNLIADGDNITFAQSITVEYREEVVPAGVGLSGTATFDEHWQMATTWRTSFVYIVERNRLSGTDDGETCAEAFELEWRRANN
jgi:hypothetical protein